MAFLRLDLPPWDTCGSSGYVKGLLMCSDWVIEAEQIGKCYRVFQRPIDRLLNALWPRAASVGKDFWALRDVSFRLARGQAMGIVGLNGAGKSTLLQLVAGTLAPSEGRMQVHGRVAALLELGSGFNPEFTGRENIYLNAVTLGLSEQEIAQRMDAIIDFSGIGHHIDQPVKTYSSGMYVRLAFSIATSVDPDILIVDEALSVGDGAFARKSFDRIMEIRQRGATILFCSHALYHVEIFCDTAMWLHEGRVREQGEVSRVLAKYQEFLDQSTGQLSDAKGRLHEEEAPTNPLHAPPSPRGHARLEAVRVFLDGQMGDELYGRSGESNLRVEIDVESDPDIPTPTVAVVVSAESGRILATQFSLDSGRPLLRDRKGRLTAIMECDRLPFNKGRYRIGAYVLCERGMHVYQWIDPVAHVNLHRDTPDLGFFVWEGRWLSKASRECD